MKPIKRIIPVDVFRRVLLLIIDIIHRLPRINGRRGAFQLLFAALYGCLAWAMSNKWPSSLAWLDEYVPSIAAGVIWGIPSLVAFIGAFLPRPKDALSYALLTAAPIIFGFLFLLGAWVAPATASAYGLLVYWAFGGGVMVVSGMSGDRDRDDRKVKVWTPG